jgi:hypothetical protein
VMLERLSRRSGEALARRTSRRSFLGRLGRGLVALAGGTFAAAAMDGGRAEAFHICGHIFTTGSCPHPYFPQTRIDRFGFPVHPIHGYPVDDDGLLYTSRQQRRRKICDEWVPEQYPFTRPVTLAGTWARCCNGRVRVVVDCCSRSHTRINGDASLAGYCPGGRRVFCITFRETKVPC